MIIEYVAVLTLTISIFTISYMIISDNLRKAYIKRKLLSNSKGNVDSKEKKRSKVYSTILADLKNKLSKLMPAKSRENMEIMLVLSGSKYSIEDILLIKFFLLMVAAFIDFLIYNNLRYSPNKLALLIMVPLVFMVMPDFLLKRKGKVRRINIKKSLPNFIDYLTISVDAGLGLDTAMVRVIKRTQGPLAEEMAYAMTEIQYGKSKKEAFLNLSNRVKLPELTSFLTALVNAEHLGISIGNILKIQGQQLRQKRKQQIQEQAYKISIKLLFPLVFFILPSLFIILLGPAAIQMYSSFIK